MKSKKWDIITCPVAAPPLCKGMGSLASAVLRSRGVDTPEKAAEFLKTDIAALHDPFLMKDMDKAAARIKAAAEKGEKIAVYGDYDVDGVTSVYILYDYLKGLGADCEYYIPERQDEGYGINLCAVEKLKAHGVGLIISVDTGITASCEVDYCKNEGIDVVITDHHECKSELPAAVAVVDPHRPDCDYPFKALAGVGVVLKLLCALSGDTEEILSRYADIVTIGTIADVMPVTGENRIIASRGLTAIENTKNPGLRALLRAAGAEGKTVTSSTVGYILSPRINAAGRMGSAELAVRLFAARDGKEAAALAEELCAQNQLRQQLENDIFERACGKLIEEGLAPEEDRIIVLWEEYWHTGIIGIVASRLSERHGCPALLFSVDGEDAKGSGRSLPGFNLFEALKGMGDVIGKFGGHELAAGLSLPAKNLESLRAGLREMASNAVFDPVISSALKIDCELTPDMLTLSEVEGLGVLEPFGAGNPFPLFCMTECELREITPVGAKKHQKLIIYKDGAVFGGIFFGVQREDLPFEESDEVDIAFGAQTNTFRDETTVQLVIRDIRLSKRQRDAERAETLLYGKFASGEGITPEEAAHLCPTREELIRIWRLLTRGARDGELTATPSLLSRRLKCEEHADIPLSRVAVGLDVLREAGLISVKKRGEDVYIRLTEINGKTDINATQALMRLRAIKKAN